MREGAPPAKGGRGRPLKRKTNDTSSNRNHIHKRIRTISGTTTLIDTVESEGLAAQAQDDERTKLGLALMGQAALKLGIDPEKVAPRRRGRPRKADHLLKHPRKSTATHASVPKTPYQQEEDEEEEEETPLGEMTPEPKPKRPRGRPRKDGQPPKAPPETVLHDEAALLLVPPEAIVKRGRGRPKKTTQTLNISRLNGKPPIPPPVPSPTPDHVFKPVENSLKTIDSSLNLTNESKPRESRSQTLRNNSQPTPPAIGTNSPAKRRGRPRKPDHLLMHPRTNTMQYQAREAKQHQPMMTMPAPEAAPPPKNRRGRPLKPTHQTKARLNNPAALNSNQQQPTMIITAPSPEAKNRKKAGGRPRKPDHLLKSPRIDLAARQARKEARLARPAATDASEQLNGDFDAVVNGPQSLAVTKEAPKKRGRPKKPDHLLLHPRVVKKAKVGAE